MCTITSEINRLQFWGGLGVVIAFFILQDSNIPKNRTTDLIISFLPLSVSSIQFPIRTTYNIYMPSWYNSQILFLYVIQIIVCRISWVENCLVHPVRLAISAALAQGWSVWRWSGKIENVDIFTVALLLASVASKTWRLGRRFLRDGKSPLTSDILPRTDYQRKSVQMSTRKLYKKDGMVHGLSWVL